MNEKTGYLKRRILINNMFKLKIGGQTVEDDGQYYAFKLREPFWSAYQKYGWINKECGFGVNKELIKSAHYRGRKLKITYKDCSYEISPVTINNFYIASKIRPIYYSRGRVQLIVIPQSKWTKI
jgi:hypothetical protein